MSLRSRAVFFVRQFPFFYPRSIIMSCEDWIARQQKKSGKYFTDRGSWFKIIFEEEFVHNPAPKTAAKPNEKAFYNYRSYRTPRAGLFFLQNGYLFGHKGLVLTRDHRVFQEFSHHFGISTLKIFFRKNLFYLVTKKCRHIDGVGAVLVSPESNNYYHWVNDVLPRIRLYGDVWDQIDHFCIASDVPEKFRDILTVFGIPAEKILVIGEREKIRFTNLYVGSLPGSEGRSARWAIEFLRSKLIADNSKPQQTKKIYLKRGAAAQRHILNELELIETLEKLNFDIVDPGTLTLIAQIQLIQQCQTVIGAHGAALSNLVFARPGTKVVELFSPDYFRTDCYYTLSSLLQLDYWYLPGQKSPGSHWGDIVIDKNLLLETLMHAGHPKGK